MNKKCTSLQLHKHAVITGIGLVSSAGIDLNAHQNIFEQGPLGLDNLLLPPFFIHNVRDIDWQTQIVQKSDQRQMGLWQKLGVYAAGLALDDADIKTDPALLASIDMIIAAGGGERDIIADSAILAKCRSANTRAEQASLLNSELARQLRPTLFLAQLSNLLAGNIAIIHKLSGASASYMGEEGAGITAIETARSWIEAGKSTRILLGGSYNAASYDMLLNLQLTTKIEDFKWRPISQRIEGKGAVVPGSGAAFLVIEEAKHAYSRNAKIYANLNSCVSRCLDRQREDFLPKLREFYIDAGIAENTRVISGIGGEPASAKAELNTLQSLKAKISILANNLGYMKEIQPIFATALSAIEIKQQLYNKIYVTMLGIKRSEVAICLTAQQQQCGTAEQLNDGL